MKNIAKASLFLACAATPIAHATTYYVNNLSACTSGCGSSYSNGIKNLSEAIALALPGDTVAIYGGSVFKANPPYYLTNAGAPVSVVPESVMNFAKLTSTNTAQATTTVRAVGPSLPKPVIRGTMVVKDGWTQVSSDSTGILYKRSWTVTKSGSSRVQEPEQVYRDTLAVPALQQVGGTVFGGYYPGVNISTIWAGSDQQSQFTAALISLSSLWPTATSTTPGYVPLSGTTTQPTLAANQFYFNNVDNVLYVKLATKLAAGEGLEVSVMPAIAANTVDSSNPTKLLRNLTLQDLVFERSNTSFNARSGMVNLAGSGINISGVDFRYGDAQCLSVQGDSNTIGNSSFNYCGQIGLKVIGSGNKIQNNFFSYNNARGFEPNWEAGATKFIGGTAGLVNSTISGNVLVANHGNGIWIDTDDAKGGSFSPTNNGLNGGDTITNNVSAFNMMGIYVELMGRVKITNNVVFGNTAQGIHLRGSPQTTVDNNVLVGNGLSGVDIEFNSAGTVLLDSGQPLEYTQTSMAITNNIMGWNRESPDHIPVAANGATTLYGNTYCGTASPKSPGSLAFVLRDGGAYPTSEYTWSKWTSMGFDIANPSKGGKASTMKIAAQPSGVTAWSTQPINIAQAGTISSISTTRSNIQKYVTDNCK
jgi:parallel beta-helix repeat protein